MIAIVITGDKNSGKSTFTHTLCSRLDEFGISTGGVIQIPPLPDQDQKEWFLSDQSTGEVRLLLTTEETQGWPRRGRFSINLDTFEWAKERLLASAEKYDFLVVDEIGPLELEGGGYHEALVELADRDEIDSSVGILLAIVRRELLEKVVERYNLEVSQIIDVNNPWEEELDKVVRLE
ncbi:MAG: hypothetical protein GX842_03740 [Spirochaetales bacterium]|nr:hypothetical protein [Spirochaetales bacterium]